MCDGHDHHHDAAHRAPLGGPVMLDIGAGVGALIVHLDDVWLDDELFAVDDAGVETHTGVWPRQVGDHLTPTAVFPGLDEGRWTLLDRHRAPWSEVVIEAGAVMELRLVGC